MTAETARQFAALEAQAQRIMAVFTQAGYEAVAPAIIQPAGVFLDAVGETLRARTYVFSDQQGTELCLRPDLTVPTCRLHLERASAPDRPARYCYNGAAFRFQQANANAAHPREFRQAGIESFGASDAIAAEAETLDLIIVALAAAGLDRRRLHLTFGDLALLRALLDALDLPAAWRQRLKARFGRPQAFRAELARMTEGAMVVSGHLTPELSRVLADVAGPDDAPRIAALLEARGLDSFGSRRIADVADGLSQILADRRAKPLSPATARLIDAYIAIDTAAERVPDAMAALAREGGLTLDGPISSFSARLAAFKSRGLDTRAATFSGSFGRALAYYTGFVFEVGGPGLGTNSPVAGGGRYDGLMRAAGSPVDIPAVGAAIHTERLLALLTERA